MDTNRETILDELNDFDKKRPNDISSILENYLTRIAKTGDPMFPWNKLKPLIRRKMEIVISEFHEGCPTDALPPLPNVDIFKYDDLRSKILEAVDSFPNAPFTIQRLCELLTSPKKHYKRTDKFMRGLEKNILVVSTVEPRSADHLEVNNNNTLIMNGIIESSAVADMLSAENMNLSSHSVLNGTPPLSDNYHARFSPDPGCIDAIVDSESSSSSDSDSSSDSLPSDYAKDGQVDSAVNSTSTLQEESTMDTSQDLLDQNETEENVSSSNELKEKDLLCMGEMSTDDISNLVADSTDCQSHTVNRVNDGDGSLGKEILDSSECQVDMTSIHEAELASADKEDAVSSEAEAAENARNEHELLIKEVASSLSQVLDATPEGEVLSDRCTEVVAECNLESLHSEEQEKTEEIEMTNEVNVSLLEDVDTDCNSEKLEPMEED